MSGEAIAQVIGALTTALWALLAFYVVWLLRTPMIAAVTRLSRASKASASRSPRGDPVH